MFCVFGVAAGGRMLRHQPALSDVTWLAVLSVDGGTEDVMTKI